MSSARSPPSSSACARRSPWRPRRAARRASRRRRRRRRGSRGPTTPPPFPENAENAEKVSGAQYREFRREMAARLEEKNGRVLFLEDECARLKRALEDTRGFGGDGDSAPPLGLREPSRRRRETKAASSRRRWRGRHANGGAQDDPGKQDPDRPRRRREPERRRAGRGCGPEGAALAQGSARARTARRGDGAGDGPLNH